MREFVSLNSKNIRLWFLLAFQAGAINAGALLACNSFVTHTTGFATLFGVGFAQKHYLEALKMLVVPGFYLFGSMITARYVELPLSENYPPNYRVPCGLVSAFLFLTALLGYLGALGNFFAPEVISKDYPLLVLLCMASGLQNALATNGKGRMIRTSHMTGNTTDLAVSLTRMIYAKKAHLKYTKNLRISYTRIGLIFSFILGSWSSAYFFQKVQYVGFLLPALTSLYIYFALTHQKDYRSPEFSARRFMPESRPHL